MNFIETLGNKGNSRLERFLVRFLLFSLMSENICSVFWERRAKSILFDGDIHFALKITTLLKESIFTII